MQQQEFSAEIANGLIHGFIRINHDGGNHYTVGSKNGYFTDILIVDDYIVASCMDGMIYYISNTGEFLWSEGPPLEKGDIYPSALELCDDGKKIISKWTNNNSISHELLLR